MSNVMKPTYTEPAVKGFTHRTAMEEAARCLLCHDAPCSKGCPAGTDPAKFIRSIRFRNVKGAAEIIRENNVLGGSCAHVCPYDRLCEQACSRCGIDRPIQIGLLQKYAVEQEQIYDMHTLQPPKEKKPQTVACVGAGPASLACAAELAKAGYGVTIFEREQKPGGVLTYGIVPSRLPQEVVDYDISHVRNLGVRFELGKPVTGADLQGFDAVFIGVGLWQPRLAGIPGAELDGVYTAVDYLKQARTNSAAFNAGQKVIVVGGGDVAVDCAVTAKLLGAEDVKIVYRRTLEEAPANMAEFQYALSLGIGITTGMAPACLHGDGKLSSAEFKGFRDGSKLEIEADTIVFALGQGAEDVQDLIDVALTDRGTIKADGSGRTSAENVFAAGDIVNGGQTVVEAVAGGKAAAVSILSYLAEKGAK